MKIFITGATGFIGRSLVGSLAADGHEVTALTRNAAKGKAVLGNKVSVIEGDPSAGGDWQEEIGRHEGIINLCGEPILKKKWTRERKQALLDSRLLPTKHIVEAIEKAPRRPQVLISGSAVSYYGFHEDELLTEDSSKGKGFAATLVIDWEETANRAAGLGVRVVALRTGIVLGRGGGALAQMLPPFKFFVGGPIGSGRQYMSWIHIDDHVAITKTALTNTYISGGLDMTAPHPVTNREFMKTIGATIGRPSWLPVPGFALKLAFGEGADLLLKGQRVLPKKAQDAGYIFQFSDLKSALADIL